MGAVLRLSHCKEDRRVADRFDHHEIDHEGCDKTLERGLSLNLSTAHCPNLKSDNHVKGREGDVGALGCNRGMLFGLDRQATFPLYGGSSEYVRRASWGGVAQLVRAAES